MKVSSDVGSGWGTVVLDNGSSYILTSLHLLGAASLELQSIWTNLPVVYTAIELANDSALIRLKTSETNLHALQCGSMASTNFMVISESGTNALKLVPINLATGASAFSVYDPQKPRVGSPILNSQTNLTGIVSVVDGNSVSMIACSSLQQWIQVQPRDFRKQMTLLTEARQAKDENATRRAHASQMLRSASWSTGFLKEHAQMLVSQLEKQP